MPDLTSTTTSPEPLTRRGFLTAAGSCAAHLAAIAAALPPATSARLWRRTEHRVVSAEPFARLEEIGDGVWALISTPLGGDRTTLCNGGIIAGRTGVVAVEGFFQRAGAEWLATQARALTGRWPTQVVLTHFHADHVAGVGGYLATEEVTLRATHTTAERALETQPPDPERAAALRDTELLGADRETVVDLGDRRIRIVPRHGHTDSDVTLELLDRPIVFCGDLVWNAMFPNFVNASPAALSASVRAIPRATGMLYVPGHGPMAGGADLDRYIAMLDEVERAARSAYASGRPFAEAGAEFKLPAVLGEWATFSPQFLPRAFEAWYRDFRRSQSPGRDA